MIQGQRVCEKVCEKVCERVCQWVCQREYVRIRLLLSWDK